MSKHATSLFPQFSALHILLVTLICLSGRTTLAQTSDPDDFGIRLTLSGVFEQVKPWLESQSTRALVIGGVMAPSSASTGPWVRQMLVEEAEKAGLQVKNVGARYTLMCEFRGIENNTSVEFEFWMRDDEDPDSRKVNEQSVVLSMESDVNKLLGLTSSSTSTGTGGFAGSNGSNSNLSGNGSGFSSANGEWGNLHHSGATGGKREGEAEIRGSTVYPAGNLTYGVEILVKRGRRYEVVTPRVEDGYVFVPLNANDAYAVRLVNHSDQPAAVGMSIDGFSLFEFNEGRRFTHLIVSPSTKDLIRGWFVSTQAAREFLVKTLDEAGGTHLDAGAIQQSRRARLGTITVQFHPASKGGQTRSGRSLFTSQGDRVKANFKSVRATWDKLPAASISIRYDKS